MANFVASASSSTPLTNILLAQGSHTAPNVQPIFVTGFPSNGKVLWTVSTSGTWYHGGVTLSTSSSSQSGATSVESSADANGYASIYLWITSSATANATWTLSASDKNNTSNQVSTAIMIAPMTATGQDLLIYDRVGPNQIATAYLVTRATSAAQPAAFNQLGAVPGVLSAVVSLPSPLQLIAPPTSSATNPATIYISCYVLNFANLAASSAGWQGGFELPNGDEPR